MLRTSFSRTLVSASGHVVGSRSLSVRLPSERFFRFAGWAFVCWIVVVWRLGYPSFWDPDEAHYAETSREMLAAHSWLVPLYNGQPFFDKPVLFHWLQMISFSLFGQTEFAARLVPALAALGLLACTAWLGVELFSADVGELGSLMLAVLPATFALSAYAILDMLFTTFLFGGVSLLWVAALRDRPHVQYPGYGLIGLAVLTKGPVALVLVGLAFVLSLVLVPAARPRLLALRWWIAPLVGLAVFMPWFLWMWFHFGDAFVDGYVLRENLWLFTKPLYTRQYSALLYFRVLLAGLLPWTPILVGRLVDAARGEHLDNGERLLWLWVLAVVGFFTFSRFRLDHYLYPAAPALCLLAAMAWQRARHSPTLRPHLGVVIGSVGTMLTLILAGVAFVVWFERVPVELPETAKVITVALIAGGLISIAQVAVRARRLPRIPVALVAGLLLTYSSAIVHGFPAFERAKPVKDLAGWVASHSAPADRVASFRLSRWNSSWRFYVNRQSELLETPEQVRAFFEAPGRGYCLMLEREYEQLREAGINLEVVHRREGLFTTTGRELRRAGGRRSGWRRFVVVTKGTD